ncbi:MAG TPA: metal ABC transporter permease [Thermoanaerobaculia bacterium]|nr:metal ABC transporter permease [Thermoanaerobaculia bacterium]
MLTQRKTALLGDAISHAVLPGIVIASWSPAAAPRSPWCSALVVAMLVVPPAAAYLLTERLEKMLAVAVLLGITSALGGYALDRWWDASIAGAMATVAGLQFLAALLVSPGHGLLARVLILRKMGRRLSGQLLLLHLQKGRVVVPAAMLERRFGWSAAGWIGS